MDRLSHEDWRKKKELDEARKAGTLPPEQDADGNLINPHIPEFMAKAPWYLNQEGPGLKHQKAFQKQHTQTFVGVDAHYRRGQKAGFQKRFKKGACTNCGATTHTAKECVERPMPKKKSAAATGRVFAADEVVHKELNLGYAGKRDRWAGYDPSEHRRTVEKFKRAEEERRRVKAEKRKEEALKLKAEAEAAGDGESAAVSKALAAAKTPAERRRAKRAAKLVAKKKRMEERAAARAKAKEDNPDAAGASDSSVSSSDSASDSDSDSDLGTSEDEDDDVLQTESQQDVATELKRFNTSTKMTVRNLRIREDRAKYLYNLDINSAHYDPKTHSMRENPNPHLPAAETTYAGDNFVRHTGDAVEFAKAQLFAWDHSKTAGKTPEEGEHDPLTAAHAQALPTQAALLRKQAEAEREGIKAKQRDALLAKYGGSEHIGGLPRELLLGETEAYVEYSRAGHVIKGKEKAIAKSKYEEDVYTHNHTTVWGSWFDRSSMAWGYSCCHSTIQSSYCTGEAGKAAAQASAVMMQRKMLEADPVEAAERRATQKPVTSKAAALYGEQLAPELDPKKLKKAMKKAAKRLREDAKADTDERKRKYNSLDSSAYDLTEEDMEAYKMHKVRDGDVMANYKDESD